MTEFREHPGQKPENLPTLYMRPAAEQHDNPNEHGGTTDALKVGQEIVPTHPTVIPPPHQRRLEPAPPAHLPAVPDIPQQRLQPRAETDRTPAPTRDQSTLHTRYSRAVALTTITRTDLPQRPLETSGKQPEALPAQAGALALRGPRAVAVPTTNEAPAIIDTETKQASAAMEVSHPPAQGVVATRETEAAEITQPAPAPEKTEPQPEETDKPEQPAEAQPTLIADTVTDRTPDEPDAETVTPSVAKPETVPPATEQPTDTSQTEQQDASVVVPDEIQERGTDGAWMTVDGTPVDAPETEEQAAQYDTDEADFIASFTADARHRQRLFDEAASFFGETGDSGVDPATDPPEAWRNYDWAAYQPPAHAPRPPSQREEKIVNAPIATADFMISYPSARDDVLSVGAMVIAGPVVVAAALAMPMEARVEAMTPGRLGRSPRFYVAVTTPRGMRKITVRAKDAEAAKKLVEGYGPQSLWYRLQVAARLF